MAAITVTLCNGQVRTYKDVDEWRADVAQESKSGQPRWHVPCDLKTIVPFWHKPEDFSAAAKGEAFKSVPYIKRRDYPVVPSKMSTAGLSGTSTEATINKSFKKLAAKRAK